MKTKLVLMASLLISTSVHAGIGVRSNPCLSPSTGSLLRSLSDSGYNVTISPCRGNRVTKSAIKEQRYYVMNRMTSYSKQKIRGQ